MKKIVSLLICFSLLFSSVAPSYAQGAAAVAQQKAAAQGLSEAVELALRQGLTPQAVEERLTVQAEKALKAASKYNAASFCAAEVYKAQEQEEFSIGDGAKYPTFIYARACERLNYEWIKEVTQGKNEVVYKAGYGSQGGATADLAWLVGRYGANSQDRAVYFKYFRGVLKQKGICKDNRSSFYVGNVESKRLEAQNKFDRFVAPQCAGAMRGIDALAAIGVQDGKYRKEAAEAIYYFMKEQRTGAFGGAVAMNGAVALMGLDTAQSYALLKQFLIEESRPTRIWTALEQLGYITLEGVAALVQEKQKKTEGKYLNSYTARFGYLDTELADRWNGQGKCQMYGDAIESVQNRFQCPMGNIYEDIGAMIAQDSKNPRSRDLAKDIWNSYLDKNYFGRYPTPLVVGVLVGGKGIFTRTQGGEAAKNLLKSLQKIDFTDMNEGTQRRLHKKAAEALGESAVVKRDQAKYERYIKQRRTRQTLGALDLVVMVVLLPGLLKGLATLGAQAIVKVGNLRKVANIGVKGAAQGAKGAAKATAQAATKSASKAGAKGAGKAASKAAPKAAKTTGKASVASSNLGESKGATLQLVNDGKGGLKAGEVIQPAKHNMTVALGEATLRSGPTLPKIKPVQAKAVAVSSPAVQVPGQATYRLASVKNALGQTVKGYVPVHPQAPVKPSLVKMIAGDLAQWGGEIRYDLGQIFRGIGHSLRSKTAGLAMLMSVNMTPVAAVGQTVAQAVNPLRAELVLAKGAAQAVQVVPVVGRTATAAGAVSFARSSAQMAQGLSTVGETAAKAAQMPLLLFVPSVATPGMMRQFGRFFDWQEGQPGQSWLSRQLPQVTKYYQQMQTYRAEEQAYQQLTTPAPQQNTPATQAQSSSSAGYLYTGIPFKAIQASLNRFKAYRHAKQVLARVEPLATDLRDVLYSAAKPEQKKEALLKLYNKGIFNQTIDALQKMLSESEWKILDPHNLNITPASRAEVLYKLYKAGVFSNPLNHLNNHILPSEFAEELAAVISSPDFSKESRRVYDDTPVLSANSNLFSGVTQGLREVNQQAVLEASREAGWAANNASSGRETHGYIKYDNDIPVYYRYADGELSKKPMIVLHQENASWYASLLAALHLSTPQGFKVPKGMALAMDENGKFKIVRLPGHLSEMQSSKLSMKQLNEIYKNGSISAEVDVPYTTSDLLAVAKMLEQNRFNKFEDGVSFQLTLNKPNSFKQFVNILGAFFGMNVDNVMVGPFKEAANSATSEMVQSAAPNMFGGVGYVTPRIAGAMIPFMQKWGLNKSTFAILSVSMATLVGSMLMGVNGISPVPSDLILLAVPMVVLVLASSLLRGSSSLLLNHYKNPQMRTAANLKMSTWQQGSRLVLSLVTAAFASAGYNEFIAVPAALLLAAVTMGLFINTSLWDTMKDSGKKASSATQTAPAQKTAPKASLKSSVKETAKFLGAFGKSTLVGILKPLVSIYRLIVPEKVTYSQDAEGRYKQEYDKEFAKDEDTKGALSRVTLAYASYAASVMLLNQLAKTGIGDASNFAVAAFMAASWLVRMKSSKWVAKGKFTDDQLTGVSFQGLALMPALLAGVSAALALTGWHWGYLAPLMLLGIGLNMSTAVPGQLDNTRLQNNVTAAMQRRKNAILQDASLSSEEKATQIADAEKMEKSWAGFASTAYNNANANGIFGIYAAVLASVLLPGDWYWIPATVFAYSSLVAAAGAAKTSAMGKSFWRALLGSRLKISAEDISQGKVSAKTFEIDSEKKAETTIASLLKGKEHSVKSLKNSLAPFGDKTVASEIKMTAILQRMIQIYNRLVAASEWVSAQASRSAFEEFSTLTAQYAAVLEQSHLSEALNRQFNKLSAALYKDGQAALGLQEHHGYMEEGQFEQLQHYDYLLRAQDLITEMRVLAANMRQGGNAVNQDTYRLFFEYHNRAQKYLQDYLEANPSEASRVKQARDRIERTFRELKASNRKSPLRDKAGQTAEKDIQNVEDLLQAY